MWALLLDLWNHLIKVGQKKCYICPLKSPSMSEHSISSEREGPENMKQVHNIEK